MRCIERDVALAADVLCVGNSSRYKPAGKQNLELSEVVVRIGTRRLSEIALSVSASRALTSQKVPWLNVDLERKRSDAAGFALDALVAAGNHQSIASGLFLSTVLSPLGRMVLATAYPHKHAALVKDCCQKGTALGPAEQRAFSKAHTEILAELLTSWRISPSVSGPLVHLHHPFSLLEMLSDQERNRVELVKLAIWVAQIALGAWESWDSIEFPPSSVLKRLRIRSIQEIVTTTRTKCGVGAGDNPRKRELGAATSKVGYWTCTESEIDAMAEMLRTMGFELDCTKIQDRDTNVANGLECHRTELESQLDEHRRRDLRIVTTEGQRQQYSGHSNVLATPTSYHRFREFVACDSTSATTLHTANS